MAWTTQYESVLEQPLSSIQDAVVMVLSSLAGIYLFIMGCLSTNYFLDTLVKAEPPPRWILSSHFCQ